jgi:hypothetical protein
LRAKRDTDTEFLRALRYQKCDQCIQAQRGQLRLAQRKVPDTSALSRSHGRVLPSASESVRTLVSRIIPLLELAAADDGEAKNERPSPILYSCRNAIIGSTLLARRAGT